MFTIKCVRHDSFHNNTTERVFSAASYETVEYANGLKFIELYNSEDTCVKHLTIANGLLLAATDYHVDTHYNTAFMTNENGKTVSTARSVGNQSDHMVSVFHKLFHGCKASMLYNNFRRELANVSTFTGWLVPLNEDEGVEFYARLHCMTQLSEDDARALFFSGWGIEIEKGFTVGSNPLKYDQDYILKVGASNKFDLGPAENVVDVYENSYKQMATIIKPKLRAPFSVGESFSDSFSDKSVTRGGKRALFVRYDENAPYFTGVNLGQRSSCSEGVNTSTIRHGQEVNLLEAGLFEELLKAGIQTEMDYITPDVDAGKHYFNLHVGPMEALFYVDLSQIPGSKFRPSVSEGDNGTLYCEMDCRGIPAHRVGGGIKLDVTVDVIVRGHVEVGSATMKMSAAISNIKTSFHMDVTESQHNANQIIANDYANACISLAGYVPGVSTYSFANLRVGDHAVPMGAALNVTENGFNLTDV